MARLTRFAVTAPSTNRLSNLERRSKHRADAMTEPTAGGFRLGGSDEQCGGRNGTNQEQTFHGKLLEGMNETEPKVTW